jgi:allantoinase
MASDTFSLRSMRVVLEGGVRPATVVVTSGKITSVEGYDCAMQPSHPLLHTDCIVFPGVVDSHVHINEPGRSHWEGFDTATRAAGTLKMNF